MIDEEALNKRYLKFTRTGGWISTGFAILVICVVGLGGWASITSITGAVIAHGMIAVESKIKTVQHLDGGIVSQIHVKDGNVVKEGDILIRLDDTETRTNLSVVVGQLHEFYGRKGRLNAELTGATTITFPPQLMQFSKDPSVVAIIAAQKAIFDERRVSKESQIRIYRQKSAEIEEEIKGQSAQRDSKASLTRIAGDELKVIGPLLDRGLTTLPRFTQLQREVENLAGDHGRLQAEIARNRSTIEENELQIVLVGQSFRDKAAEELKEINPKIAELEDRRLALVAKLNLMDIRAPISGKIHDLAVTTVGGVVQPARPVVQIIPEHDKLLIESKVATQDIDQVKIGHEATVRIAAFDARTTPLLTGTVTYVAGAQLIDPVSNVPYYSVKIEIPDREVLKLASGQILVPGMPIEAFIRTSERTVMEYLLKPLADQIRRAFRER